MFGQARREQIGLAWLADSHLKRVIEVHSWQGAAQRELSFFAPDFALKSSTPWLCGREIPWRPSELDAATASRPVLQRRREPSSEAFERLHGDILNRLAHHEFQKVVPIVTEELEFSAPLHADCFARAWAEHSNQFSYGFDFQGEGLAGVTPELLFEVEGDRLTTMALAGTGRTDGPSLLDDPKERREHQLVIDHIAGVWDESDQVEVGVTQERSFGTLKHLYTPLHVRLQRAPNFMDLIVRLHPTAALGGWPRRPAIEWLERQEFHVTRRRFGAPFGWQDGEGRMRCVVAIRGLQWHGSKALLSAGCGVVIGSQADKEWRELALKRRAAYAHLGLDL